MIQSQQYGVSKMYMLIISTIIFSPLDSKIELHEMNSKEQCLKVGESVLKINIPLGMNRTVRCVNLEAEQGGKNGY
jgi:hypothetical protein